MMIMYLYKCAQYLKQSNYFDKDKEKTTVESSTSSFMLLRSSGKYESRNNVKLEVVNSVLFLCIYLSIYISIQTLYVIYKNVKIYKSKNVKISKYLTKKF